MPDAAFSTTSSPRSESALDCLEDLSLALGKLRGYGAYHQATEEEWGRGIPVGRARKTALDREREYQQNDYESLRNSGFNDRAEAFRNDVSKC
jgi:hypothetical protein